MSFRAHSGEVCTLLPFNVTLKLILKCKSLCHICYCCLRILFSEQLGDIQLLVNENQSVQFCKVMIVLQGAQIDQLHEMDNVATPSNEDQ